MSPITMPFVINIDTKTLIMACHWQPVQLFGGAGDCNGRCMLYRKPYLFQPSTKFDFLFPVNPMLIFSTVMLGLMNPSRIEFSGQQCGFKVFYNPKMLHTKVIIYTKKLEVDFLKQLSISDC